MALAEARPISPARCSPRGRVFGRCCKEAPRRVARGAQSGLRPGKKRQARARRQDRRAHSWRRFRASLIHRCRWPGGSGGGRSGGGAREFRPASAGSRAKMRRRSPRSRQSRDRRARSKSAGHRSCRVARDPQVQIDREDADGDADEWYLLVDRAREVARLMRRLSTSDRRLVLRTRKTRGAKKAADDQHCDRSRDEGKTA